MQVKIKESWVLYDKPGDRCIIRFKKEGMEVVRYTFYFSGNKQDYFAGTLTDYYPISPVEEQVYISERRQKAKMRTRSLKEV